VLQYPLRPSYRPYGDQGQLERVELKAKSRRLRFLYRLHQNDHYAEEDVMHEKYEQRHTLNSVVVANPNCSYAVGVIRQGRMTLTPIRSVNQLRPDFEDFEESISLLERFSLHPTWATKIPCQDPEKEKDAASDASEDAPPEAVDMAPLRVEYVRDKAETGCMCVCEVMADAEDAWKRLDFFDASSTEAADIYLQHIVFAANEAAEAEMEGQSSEHPKLQPLDLDGDGKSFIHAMCGQAEQRAALRQQRQKAALNQGGLSSYVLSKMPTERQVEAILRHFGVAAFAQLRKRLPQSTLRGKTEEALLAMLKDCGVLVCGNWVLKSPLANFDGMEANARDVLLTMLNRKAFVASALRACWASRFSRGDRAGALAA
ncbi:unnamed protein product, partial [Effrenium voratum]